MEEKLTLGEALEFLKEGRKLARKNWNGKDMFIYYVPANTYPASRNTLGTLSGLFENDMVPYRAYIAMKTVNNEVVPWVASQSDILENDWFIVS